LEKLVKDLSRDGKVNNEWASETEAELKIVRQYIRTDFKAHIKPDSRIVLIVLDML
jgi:hypothetical protein